MRNLLGLIGLCLCLAWLAPTAQAEEPPAVNKELAKKIQQLVIAKMPREFEEAKDWGGTIPLPANVRFPRLKRTVIKVGDRYEVPHGTWQRTKISIRDPERDVVIQIPRVETKQGKTYLRIEATVALSGARERKEWANGVQLVGVVAEAQSVVTIGLDVEAVLSLDTSRLPPTVKTDVKLAEVQLLLRDFQLQRVGPVLVSVHGELAEELKRFIQQQLTAQEPRVKEQANQAITKALKEGPGIVTGLLAPRK